MLTAADAGRVAALSRLADKGRPDRLARLAALALDRGGSVAGLLSRLSRLPQDEQAWREARAAVDAHGGDGLSLLDLVVEVGQVLEERAGRPRTWRWPNSTGAP